jgi:hypothetical protein
VKQRDHGVGEVVVAVVDGHHHPAASVAVQRLVEGEHPLVLGQVGQLALE